MTLILIGLATLILAFAIFVLLKNKKLENDLLRIQKETQAAITEAQQESERKRQLYESEKQAAIVVAQQESERKRALYESETQRVYAEAQSAVGEAQKQLDQQFAEVNQESERIRQHYEAEARKSQEAAEAMLAKTLKELEPLRKYESLRNAEEEVKRILADALTEAAGLRKEGQTLLEQTRTSTADERAQAVQKTKDIREQADAMLNQAIRDAGRIVADAENQAKQMAGDAYTALRDKQLLEQAAAAMRNVIEGYGDRYVIPTHSLLDDLAVEFGYDAAGASLKSAREQSRRMVEQGQAATCDYVEASRRETAIRFVIDAFNGRVDAILSRSRHDNFGTLEQEIKDAFNLVNLNGEAFRNARILQAYLDVRLAELKWAVVVHELARKQREEQRYLRERMRDEQKAEEERQQKLREAEKEQEIKRKALEEAEKRLAIAHASEKAQLEQEVQKLRQERDEAAQKTIKISQQTKEGHVYVISNIGSFGEGVYKIGQTLREPDIRIDELGGASVPFEFDIHALIKTKSARALEHKLHKLFLPMQVNKINFRKEFFRISLTEIHQAIEKLKQGEDFIVKEWTDKAVATEYKDSRDIENDPEKKVKWLARQKALADRQLKMDALHISATDVTVADDDNESS